MPDIEFQSSPSPKAGRSVIHQQAVSEVVDVSILAQPEGRALLGVLRYNSGLT